MSASDNADAWVACSIRTLSNSMPGQKAHRHFNKRTPDDGFQKNRNPGRMMCEEAHVSVFQFGDWHAPFPKRAWPI
jgi:hypothetical protein